MPSLVALFLLLLGAGLVLIGLAFTLLLLLFTPTDPTPRPSESTYLSPCLSSPGPHPLPSLLDSPSSSHSKAKVELSVVVPAYNERKRLGVMLRPTVEFLETRPLSSGQGKGKEAGGVGKGSYEILIVDDGSTDGTAEHALELARKIEGSLEGGRMKRGEVRVVKLERNRGKGGATKHGVLHSSGARILFVDADGATHFPDLELLEAELDKIEASQEGDGEGGGTHGLVVGSRAHLVSSEAVVKRSALRNLLMRTFHLYLSLLGLSTIRDTQCGFKLFTLSTAILLFPSLHSPGWIFDCELLLLAMRCGVEVREVGVKWEEVGGSKLDVVRDSVRMAMDLLVIRGNYATGRWKTPAKVGGGIEKETKKDR
ncbi:hypothetical protein JCM8547_004186 [Rhodosporidiobolus lusitaniae]